MRKPLVVVCGVTAVLLAGGIAATTAGAETAPDVPSLPGLTLPDIPAVPQLPVNGAQGGGATDQDGTTSQNLPGGLDLPGLDAPAGDRPAQAQADRDQTGQDSSDQDQSAQRPGGQAAPDQAAQDHIAQDKGGAQAEPGGQARPQQKPAAAGLAAAQRDVSPSSVSTNPAAPVQQQVLALVNANRRRGGCTDLSIDRRLIEAAYGHAADMARHRYFAHESPNGEGAGDRVQDAGYQWSRYGENIARGQESPYVVVDGWMHSPVHRENIMDCRLHQMGIGLAFSSDKEPYWVQDFATPW